MPKRLIIFSFEKKIVPSSFYPFFPIPQKTFLKNELILLINYPLKAKILDLKSLKRRYNKINNFEEY